MITIKLDVRQESSHQRINQLINKSYHIIALEDKYNIVLRKY